MKNADIIVVGGGAAGLMAAYMAASSRDTDGRRPRVLLLEKNHKPGRKLAITGKGRCNLTNACEGREFAENIVTGGRFMYSALSRFSSRDLMALIEGQGVPLKTERGQRVFPASDSAFDIVDALKGLVQSAGVTVRTGTAVTGVRKEEAGFTVLSENESFTAAALILATGGISYPLTGSTGDGHRFAKELGHELSPLRPALVPLCTEEAWPRDMMGLSLRNTGLWAELEGRKVFEDFGEILFTLFGVSGPMAITASSLLQSLLNSRGKSFESARPVLHLDLKPVLSEDELDARLQREIAENSAGCFRELLASLLPQKAIPVYLKLLGIPAEKKLAELSRTDRKSLLKLLKDLTLHVNGTRGPEEAIITQGGVCTKQVDPKTMQSKCCPGLFLAGELLDIDALTGGFNLQLAFSSGAAAGRAAGEFVLA